MDKLFQSYRDRTSRSASSASGAIFVVEYEHKIFWPPPVKEYLELPAFELLYEGVSQI